MRRDTLLRELAALTHDGRMRRMVELGQSADAGPVLAELGRGNGYERRLALQAAWGSRDGAFAFHGLADASRLAAVLCADHQLAGALEAAPPAARRALLATMRKHGRVDAADTFLDALRERGEPAFGALLRYGSAAFVARRLPEAAETAGLDWHALARTHPATVAGFLSGAMRAAAEPDRRLLAQARAALPALSSMAPDAALELVGALAAHVPLASLPLRVLAGHRPAAVAELCLLAPPPCPVSFASAADRLPRELLLALLARFGSLGEGRGGALRWLRRVRPELRGEAFDVANRAWRDRDGAVALAILTLMPRPVREAEARRHLVLPELATRPAARLPYAGLLPWERARFHVDPFLGDPDPDLRMVALVALAATVRFERGRARDLLALVGERRHEQDPVRNAMLGALAALPPATWGADHLPALGALIRHALDAADLSPATALQTERILLAQLPRFPGWAAEWLATLARERGNLSLPGHRLRREDVQRLAPALTPVLAEWVRRERHVPLFALVAVLGRHLAPAWDGLADLLERVALRGTAGSAAGALQAVARNMPGRLAALAPVLLRADPSWATQAPVYDHLHRHRQDLLTPFLGRRSYRGRFATGDTRVVLPFRTGFRRWTPAQQQLFAESVGSVGSVVADEKRDSPALLYAIAQLAALPDVGLETLERLAAPSEPRPAARDAALRGLGRRDAGDGLPAVLAALGDARARVAAYALRRSLLEMMVPRALAVLQGVGRDKVTVAKEVVRLAGELPGEAAYAWLLGLADGDLHRDVFVALLRALWSRLDRDETWTILRRAAASPDSAIATAATRVPGDALSPGADDRLCGLLAACLSHPDPRVRSAALARCASQPLADRLERLLAPLLRALGSPLPDECRGAAAAVFATGGGRRAARIGEAAAALRANRFAVSVLASHVQQHGGRERERYAATVAAVLRALGGDPALAGLRAELATAALPAAALPGWLEQEAGTLHEGALPRAATKLEAPAGLDTRALEAIEAALSSAGNERLRRLALAALRGQAGAAAGRGWTPERLLRLARFRADPSPLVAEPAQFTFPPGESGPAG